MGCHGPQRTAGEMRMIVKSTQEDLVKAHATLKQKMEERMLAEQRRDDMFSKESMKFFGNLASNGLNFSNLGELRSLKVSPPPLVQLVTRCVCTLIMGDDIGQAAVPRSQRSRATRLHYQPQAHRASANCDRGQYAACNCR